MPSDVVNREFASEAERDAFVLEIRTKVNSLRHLDGTTVGEIAKQSEVAPGTLGPFLGGQYKGKNEVVAAKLELWLLAREERKAALARIRPAPGFQMTATARAIMGTLQHAQHTPDFALIMGTPGVGKSTTIQQYRRANPNVHVIEGEPCKTTPNALISEVALALGISGFHTPQRNSRFISERLRDSGALLILDEAQNWSTLAIDQLRRWHDSAEVGVALVGNPSVARLVSGGAKAADFAQLTSRVGARLNLKRAKGVDMEVLLEAWGIQDGEIRAELTGIGGKPGALRQMVKTIRMGLTMAAGEQSDLTLRHVRLAAEQLSITGAQGAAG
jgi:DNA transposition AAA+ family ATPase